MLIKIKQTKKTSTLSINKNIIDLTKLRHSLWANSVDKNIRKYINEEQDYKKKNNKHTHKNKHTKSIVCYMLQFF